VKNVLSISLIALIIFSGIRISFATHYCGGSVAATKVSLNGELASCGMEHHSDNILLQAIFTTRCCEDVKSDYSICNNYVPSSYFMINHGQHAVPVLYASYNNLISKEIIVNSVNHYVRPPGTSFPNMVSLPALCVFLI
jgi:hypothetical protein